MRRGAGREDNSADQGHDERGLLWLDRYGPHSEQRCLRLHRHRFHVVERDAPLPGRRHNHRRRDRDYGHPPARLRPRLSTEKGPALRQLQRDDVPSLGLFHKASTVGFVESVANTIGYMFLCQALLISYSQLPDQRSGFQRVVFFSP